MKYAITISNVRKEYKLYKTNFDRLKDACLIKKTKKYYDDFIALDNISFNVRKGEIVGIIGSNGSGKSTLLKIITNVLNPTQGEVVVNGRVSAMLELGSGFNLEFN